MTWEQFVALHIPNPVTVPVERFEGSGPYGPVYAPPVDLAPCVVEETTRLVRVQTLDAAGHEQISSATVYGPIMQVPPGSRVTLPSGRIARVLAVSVLHAHGWDLPEHVELAVE